MTRRFPIKQKKRLPLSGCISHKSQAISFHQLYLFTLPSYGSFHRNFHHSFHCIHRCRHSFPPGSRCILHRTFSLLRYRQSLRLPIQAISKSESHLPSFFSFFMYSLLYHLFFKSYSAALHLSPDLCSFL